jgi:hypothetical protein
MRGGAFALLLAGAAALLPGVSQAQPISAEVAKKCKILRAQQFPPRQIGNPAAGSAHGSGQDKSGAPDQFLINVCSFLFASIRLRPLMLQPIGQASVFERHALKFFACGRRGRNCRLRTA